ncbi:uncharacterized protein F5147DRAFT_649667 [Suillus discolor]|uniref:Uncharacterized protein n=1 Tax=Suillus discolor TaxID=1912936 RepID=A0A9P7FEN5_9AGAM|nr:uncharacterized protein F5147DRAFT_649667 [Suillus discolor]KAG2115285.1 hypothetical protein F5147DRAFT_649667 [Suillus discolor]
MKYSILSSTTAVRLWPHEVPQTNCQPKIMNSSLSWLEASLSYIYYWIFVLLKVQVIKHYESHEVPECIRGDLSTFVQAFSEEFIVHHLQHFAEHYHIENIIPPQHGSTATMVVLLRDGADGIDIER